MLCTYRRVAGRCGSIMALYCKFAAEPEGGSVNIWRSYAQQVEYIFDSRCIACKRANNSFIVAVAKGY